MKVANDHCVENLFFLDVLHGMRQEAWEARLACRVELGKGRASCLRWKEREERAFIAFGEGGGDWCPFPNHVCPTKLWHKRKVNMLPLLLFFSLCVCVIHYQYHMHIDMIDDELHTEVCRFNQSSTTGPSAAPHKVISSPPSLISSALRWPNRLDLLNRVSDDSWIYEAYMYYGIWLVREKGVNGLCFTIWSFFGFQDWPFFAVSNWVLISSIVDIPIHRSYSLQSHHFYLKERNRTVKAR